MRSLGLSLLVLLATQVSNGQDGCQPCEPRACPPPCGKTCRYEQKMKKVKKVVWQCKCVDVCIAGRSQEDCSHAQACCGPQASCGASAGDGSNRVPTCNKVVTKKHLVRCEIEVEVPEWKCVIEDGNGACGECGTTGPTPIPAEPPPAPPTKSAFRPVPSTNPLQRLVSSVVR